MESGSGLQRAVRPAPKKWSLQCDPSAVWGGVLWIPIQVEQHYCLNRIKRSGVLSRESRAMCKGVGKKPKLECISDACP